MKKFLAVLLACSMVFTGLVFSVSAADTKVQPQSILVSDCDVKAVGWNWGINLDLETKDGKTGCVVSKFDANKEYAAVAGMLANYVAPVPVDVSEYAKVRMDFYVSDASVLKDITLCFELTSSGTCDVDENQFIEPISNFIVGGELKDGWNTLEHTIGGGGLDASKWNFTRFFNNGTAFTTGDDGLVVAIDNLRFVKADDTELPISSCDPEIKGWTGVQAQIYTKQNEEDKDDIDRKYVYVNAKGDVGAGGAFIAQFNYSDANEFAKKDSEKIIDATGMKFLTFDLYLSDVAAADCQLCVEVNSAGKNDDQNEMQTILSMRSMLVEEPVVGWNKAQVVLGSVVGDVDMTAINYVRIFNMGYNFGTEGVVIGFDNLKLWDGLVTLADGFAHELHTFRVFEESEAAYLDKNNAHTTSAQRFTDGGAYVIYKYTIANAATAKDARWLAKIGAQLLLEVSMDGENFTPFFDSKGAKIDQTYQSYDLTEYVDFEKSNTIYIKVNDSEIPGGDGGSIFTGADIILDVTYEVPEEGSTNPHYTLVSPCESTAGWDGGSDKKPTVVAADEDGLFVPTQGKGALNWDYGAKKGGAFICFRAENTRTKSYDLTNFWAEGALVFDLYVPDDEAAESMKALQFSMELSSADHCDWSELACNGKNFADFVEGGLISGVWNEVVIPFSAFTAATDAGGTGAFDKTHWNYLRAHIVGGEATNFNFTIDNFRIWDGSDGRITEAAAEFTIFTDAETPYLFKDAANKNPDCRYTDGQGYVIYKFDVKQIYNVLKLEWTATMGQQLVLDFSLDGDNWTNVYTYDGPMNQDSDGLAIKEYTYDLTPFINTERPDFETVYLKISDAHPENGWGGSIHKNTPAKLLVTYIPPLTPEDRDLIEMTATAHKVPICGCSEAWSGTKVCKDNFSAGTSSVRIDWNANGNIHQFKIEEPVDCTGMDTMEFDIFISHENWLHIQYVGDQSLELTSSGTCDNQEINWPYNSLFDCIEGEAKVGEWNHVVLPVNIGGGFNIANVNFLRFYHTKCEDFDLGDDEEMYILIDNVCLTDRQAMKKQLAKPEAMPVMDQIEALAAAFAAANSTITAENYEALKAQYTAAVEAKDGLSSDAAQWITGTYSKTLSDLKKAIKAYEKALEEAQNPTKDPTTDPTTNPTSTDPTTTDPTTDPTEPTDDKGCKSIVAAGVGFMVVAALGAAAFVFKKKED